MAQRHRTIKDRLTKIQGDVVPALGTDEGSGDGVAFIAALIRRYEGSP